jgi:ABC-type transport system involved in multi-copper enzyme maturation permease subunit
MIVRQNPIVLKELRARMRGKQASILLTAYLGVLALLVILVYLVFRSSSSATGSANDLRMLGKTIFGLVVGVEFLAVCFIAPGLTAGAISGERERQTLDLLRTTLLSARGLVFGKFFTAISFLVLLLFTALPVQSLAFLFGGVALEEILVGALLLFVTAMTFCAAAMAFSSFFTRTLTSTVLAYGFVGLLEFGLPFLALVFSGLLSGAFANWFQQLSTTAEVLLILGGWLLVSSNLISTAIASELILTEQGSLYLFTMPLFSQGTIRLSSPWIVYTLINLLLSALLIWISIRRVRRPEK